jgi:hypothetical protein
MQVKDLITQLLRMDPKLEVCTDQGFEVTEATYDEVEDFVMLSVDD